MNESSSDAARVRHKNVFHELSRVCGRSDGVAATTANRTADSMFRHSATAIRYEGVEGWLNADTHVPNAYDIPQCIAHVHRPAVDAQNTLELDK